jgi:hypothetical protein
MTRIIDGWLDTLARRVARPAAARTSARPTPPYRTEVDEPGGQGLDQRYPRNAALKLAVAAAATASLGLGRAAPARALDRGPCLEQCAESHQKALESQLEACDKVFQSATFETTLPGSWARVRALFRHRGYGFTYEEAADVLNAFCRQKAQAENAATKRACYSRCEKEGKPTPPANPPPPSVPPVPTPPTGLCANCNKVGGTCCGPYSVEKPLCACATPGVPCLVYGCGG